MSGLTRTYSVATVGEFADHLAGGSNRRQSPHAHVDADSGVGLGNAGPLGTSDGDSDGGDDSLSLARDRDAEDLGSIHCNEPFDPSGVLVGAQGPEHRQGEVAPVGFEPHGASGKGKSVAVSATLLETGEADLATGDLARSRLLPAPVGVGGAAHAVGEDFLRDLGPPDLTRSLVDTDGVLLGVPTLA